MSYFKGVEHFFSTKSSKLLDQPAGCLHLWLVPLFTVPQLSPSDKPDVKPLSQPPFNLIVFLFSSQQLDSVPIPTDCSLIIFLLICIWCGLKDFWTVDWFYVACSPPQTQVVDTHSPCSRTPPHPVFIHSLTCQQFQCQTSRALDNGQDQLPGRSTSLFPAKPHPFFFPSHPLLGVF